MIPKAYEEWIKKIVIAGVDKLGHEIKQREYQLTSRIDKVHENEPNLIRELTGLTLTQLHSIASSVIQSLVSLPCFIQAKDDITIHTLINQLEHLLNATFYDRTALSILEQIKETYINDMYNHATQPLLHRDMDVKEYVKQIPFYHMTVDTLDPAFKDTCKMKWRSRLEYRILKEIQQMPLNTKTPDRLLLEMERKELQAYKDSTKWLFSTEQFIQTTQCLLSLLVHKQVDDVRDIKLLASQILKIKDNHIKPLKHLLLLCSSLPSDPTHPYTLDYSLDHWKQEYHKILTQYKQYMADDTLSAFIQRLTTRQTVLNKTRIDENKQEEHDYKLLLENHQLFRYEFNLYECVRVQRQAIMAYLGSNPLYTLLQEEETQQFEYMSSKESDQHTFDQQRKELEENIQQRLCQQDMRHKEILLIGRLLSEAKKMNSSGILRLSVSPIDWDTQLDTRILRPEFHEEHFNHIVTFCHSIPSIQYPPAIALCYSNKMKAYEMNLNRIKEQYDKQIQKLKQKSKDLKRSLLHCTDEETNDLLLLPTEWIQSVFLFLPYTYEELKQRQMISNHTNLFRSTSKKRKRDSPSLIPWSSVVLFFLELNASWLFSDGEEEDHTYDHL